MKKTLIISTYYNAPHFLELQQQSMELFMQDEYDFCIFDDSADDTKSILTNRIAREEIKEECERLGIRGISVPQSVHANVSKGGLVPDGLPAGHPTERHRACLHWILQHGLDELNYSEYDAVLLMESDMLFRMPVSIADALVDYDLIGSGYPTRTMIRNRDNPIQVWPDRISHLDEITISHFNMMMTIFNPKVVTNLDSMNIGGFAGTDTGGQTHFFFEDNPYRIRFIHHGKDFDVQVSLLTIKNIKTPEFVHYGAGSNWDYQSVPYYKEKLHRMLNEYIPEMGGIPTISNITSRNGKHTFK